MFTIELVAFFHSLMIILIHPLQFIYLFFFVECIKLLVLKSMYIVKKKLKKMGINYRLVRMDR